MRFRTRTATPTPRTMYSQLMKRALRRKAPDPFNASMTTMECAGIETGDLRLAKRARRVAVSRR